MAANRGVDDHSLLEREDGLAALTRAGELAVWRARAGLTFPAGPVAPPFAAELAGDPTRAAQLWDDLRCPYEGALARVQAGDEPRLRQALGELQALGALPAARLVARRLRELGARDIPRGPHPATTATPGALTPRELEVLALLAQGLHDMGDPVSAVRHVLSTLKPDGTWMIVEPNAGDHVQDNFNPVGRAYYGFSTLLCTPASLSQEVGLALGAQAGEARIRDVVETGGFTRFRRVAETPFNLVFEARP